MPDRRQHWEGRYSSTTRVLGPASGLLQSLVPSLKPGRALDIASGEGRNAVALAERGHSVTAIDIARAGLTRLRGHARDRGVSIDTIQADLDQYPLPRNHFDLAVKTLYLQRNIFAAMKECLVPGGIAVVETFLIDQREIGHPRNPAFLLERGELVEVFADFDILVSAEGLFEMGAERAFLSRLVARRP
jgi:SAM-dependent methyltransferase